MTDTTTLDTIETLQSKHQNIKITLGASMGMVLIIYFFTFAMLVDKFPPAFFIFEAITSVMIFISFFKLNAIAFAILKPLAGRQRRALLSTLNANDMEKKPEEIAAKLN